MRFLIKEGNRRTTPARETPEGLGKEELAQNDDAAPSTETDGGVAAK